MISLLFYIATCFLPILASIDSSFRHVLNFNGISQVFITKILILRQSKQQKKEELISITKINMLNWLVDSSIHHTTFDVVFIEIEQKKPERERKKLSNYSYNWIRREKKVRNG